jgi:hypothetical protein
MEIIGFGQNGLERFAGTGHWNDPDMLETDLLVALQGECLRLGRS